MARDRKRAKQRRARGGGAAVGRRPASDGAPNGASAPPQSPTSEPPAAGADAPGELERGDVPGALDHASADVDEFDAALVRGAGGVPASGEELSELEAETEAEVEDALQEPQGPSGPGGLGGGRGSGGGRGGDGGGGGEVVRPSGAPLRGGNRAIGFLRASWAELQRVQWPDRRQVTQATAVVLGFVAIAGLYLALADYVAKEIVEFILG
ncbi:MAG: secE [Solirubrobacterales bacterium]|nr:secE [Solirubrobacterales bacterium]